MVAACATCALNCTTLRWHCYNVCFFARSTQIAGLAGEKGGWGTQKEGQCQSLERGMPAVPEAAAAGAGAGGAAAPLPLMK